jgi:hypothetical protein
MNETNPIGLEHPQRLERGFYVLSRGQLVYLFVAFGILLALSVGAVLSVYASVQTPELWHGAVVAVLTALGSSSMAYMRKLYKASMDGRIVARDNVNIVQNIGTMAYFWSRPVFASLLALAALVAALAGAITLVPPEQMQPQQSMLHFSLLVGLVVGFATGRAITELDSVSVQMISKLSQKGRANEA